jgi:para-nitrobenzyl esterase
MCNILHSANSNFSVHISIPLLISDTMAPSIVTGMTLLTYVLLLFSSVSARHSNNLVVATTSGTFEGFYPHKTVRAFLGIPYAKPPLDPLRFSSPEPLVSRNKTVLDATKFGNTCYQFQYKTIGFEKRGPTTGESEDCLTINVWGPATRKSKELRPSLIWVHGGGFGEGATSDFSILCLPSPATLQTYL